MRIIRVVATVVSCAAFFAACSLQTADFSAYTDKNLIPEAQLDQWIPDQDLTTAPGNLYMGFDRIDNAAAATYASVTGFADSAALYSGLPASATMANGALPPVYRLEIKNLFVDGDLEGSPLGVSNILGGPQLPGDITNNPGRFSYFASSDPSPRTWAIINNLGPNYLTNATIPLGLNSGRVLTVTQGAHDQLSIDLSTNLTTWEPAGANYNLGFRAFISSPPDFYLSFGSSPSSENAFFHINIVSAGVYRFPQDMAIGSASSFNTYNGNKFLYFNSTSTRQVAITSVNFDDFMVVRTGKTYAIRYEVPLSTGAGLHLVQGGTYTLTAYIRQDPTAVFGNANKVPNRFTADKISLAIADSVGTKTQYWSNGTAGAQSAPSTSDWTKISASFTGMFNNSTTFNSAASSQKMLQLSIIVTDTTNDLTQFPGSILITSPNLTFKP